MKTTYIFVVFMFLGMVTFGQYGKINYFSGCDNLAHIENYNFRLENKTIFANGHAKDNCCGNNYLTYTITDNVIKISKIHTNEVCYCLCLYPFDFSIEGCSLSSYRIIVLGTKVDTTVYNQGTLVNIANKTQKPIVTIFPNPAKTKITVNMSESKVSSAIFEIYNIIGQKVFSKEDVRETFDVERGSISKGAYFYKLIGKDGAVFTGKLLFE